MCTICVFLFSLPFLPIHNTYSPRWKQTVIWILTCILLYYPVHYEHLWINMFTNIKKQNKKTFVFMLCFVLLFDYCRLYSNILIALISNVLIFVCPDFHVSIYTVTGTFFFPYPWGHHLVMHRLYLSHGVKGAKLVKDIGLQLTT